MKVLVTGAAGRLGSCVCRLLVEQGIEFLAVDKFPADHSDYPIETVDLSGDTDFEALLEGVDVLAHFANYNNWNSADPEEVYAVNVAMNMHLFSAAAKQECQRIVFSSSVQVLDGQMPITDRSQHPVLLPYLPLDSAMPAIPRNTYGLSKQAGENMLEYFVETVGMTCIAIRYPLLIDSAMMADALNQGGMPRGNPYDAYTYLPVYSAAEVAVCACMAKVEGYQNYFVASKDNLELKPAQEVIDEGLSQVPIKGSVTDLDSLVDCSKVEADLGWRQPVSMQESFQKYGSLDAVKPYV